MLERTAYHVGSDHMALYIEMCSSHFTQSLSLGPVLLTSKADLILRLGRAPFSETLPHTQVQQCGSIFCQRVLAALVDGKVQNPLQIAPLDSEQSIP